MKKRQLQGAETQLDMAGRFSIAGTWPVGREAGTRHNTKTDNLRRRGAPSAHPSGKAGHGEMVQPVRPPTCLRWSGFSGQPPIGYLCGEAAPLKGARTRGAAFSVGIEQSAHPQSRIHGQHHLAGDR